MKKISKTKTSVARTPQQSNAVLVLEESLKAVLDAIGFRAGDPGKWTSIDLKIDIPNTIRLELALVGGDVRGLGNEVDSAFIIDHSLVSMLTTTNIDDLLPHTKAGAQSLVKAFGALIVITSGKRTVLDQCRAMAQNIVNTGNRKWIENTYANSSSRKKLQDWVDANPASTTVGQITTGLEGVMNGFTDAERNAISYHISGAAFDLSPVGGPDGDKIKAAIKALPDLRKFIDGEGGVSVWHLEFNE